MTLQPSVARSPSRPEFIALLAALMALNALAIDIMLPALPNMGDALGLANANERQLVVSAYVIGFGSAQLAFGPLSDHFGRRGPLFAGIVLYVVCAVAAVFAPTFGILLALRFVQGLGAASSRVIAMSAIRDTYHGREMASVISLTFMVFMVIPILAPSIGQGLLLVGSWHTIFAFMAGLAAVIGLWAYFRLPETLHPEFRRDLTLRVIAQGFAAVVSNRSAFLYGLCGMLFFASMFGFLVSSQQIFVGIYGLGAMFPLAFASVALVMAASNFINSRIVGHFGMRRVGHFAMLVYIACATTILVLALIGPVPFWVYFALLAGQQSVFGWATSNMNSLSMEPLGRVAGTAAAVFGFMQTVGGAIIGTFIGQLFNGTLVPVAAASATLGGLILVCVLIAEKGRLFGVGAEYQPAPGMAE